MTDAELLVLFRDPQTAEQAFRQIIRMYQKPIYYYIRRMILDHDDSDDVTQMTFIKAWKGLPGFRGEAKLDTWLHTIAYHESLTFIEQKKRVGKVPLSEIHGSLDYTLQQDELYSGDEIQRRLQVALATLPAKQKAVFVMKYFEEKKYEEIAEITGTSVGALKASFHHAVQKIQAHVGRNVDQSLSPSK